MTMEESGQRELNVTLKRRLRRLRIAALKDGVVMPYDPVSHHAPPPAKDAPKLTNTAKRNMRRIKRMAADMEAKGLLEDDNDAATYLENWKNNRLKAQAEEKEGGISGDKKIKKKKKKKIKNKKDHVDLNSSNVSIEDSKVKVTKEKKAEKLSKKRKKDESGHTRFSESEPEEEPVEDKETKKRLKKIKLVPKTNDVEDDAGEGSCAEKVVDSSEEPANGETKHPKKKKSDKVIDKTKPDKSKLPPKKRRFVLFVGNLSYNATEEDIRAHFSKVGPIVSVRMARDMDDEAKTKCRGFCHLDLENEETYLKALSLNHTFMDKRRINVEYSTGQTKELKAEQKKKGFKMKALYKSGRGFEVMNPVGGDNKAVKRSKARQVTQKEGNKFWV